MQRQKTIAVSVGERALLGKRKEAYESITGERCDWGEFLTAISLLGLEALQDGYKILIAINVQRPTKMEKEEMRYEPT